MDGISGGWKLPTAGFYRGGYDFGVTAGSMHMARVSGHYLSYECPGTYLNFFYGVYLSIIQSFTNLSMY